MSDLCEKLIAALDWQPLGDENISPLEQIALIQLIRRNALGYGELMVIYSQVNALLEEKIQQVEALKLSVADALRTLQQVQL